MVPYALCGIRLFMDMRRLPPGIVLGVSRRGDGMTTNYSRQRVIVVGCLRVCHCD